MHGGFLPMLPCPAAVLLDLNPAAKSYFALGDLDGFFLALCVFADSPVIGRNFCAGMSAVSKAGGRGNQGK